MIKLYTVINKQARKQKLSWKKDNEQSLTLQPPYEKRKVKVVANNNNATQK